MKEQIRFGLSTFITSLLSVIMVCEADAQQRYEGDIKIISRSVLTQISVDSQQVTLSIPDQSISMMSADTMSVTPDSLYAEWRVLKASYRAAFRSDS